jgi:hypothetical protein
MDSKTVEKIEKLAQKMSDEEYTSFSALSRKLLNIGLNSMSKPPQISKCKIVVDNGIVFTIIE